VVAKQDLSRAKLGPAVLRAAGRQVGTEEPSAPPRLPI